MTLRRAVQLSLLGLFVYLIALTRWPPTESVMVDAFLRIDPLLSLQAVLASRAWVGAAGYGILLLGLTLVLGRFFCGWMCPLGTCLEVGDGLLFKKRKRRWGNHERRLRGVKYGLLAVILLTAAAGEGLAYLADPICWITRVFTYAVWPIGAGIGNGLLDVSRPLFEALGWMNLARADLDQPVLNGFGLVAVAFLGTALWLGRYQRRFWCRVLCPLGALFALPARFSLFYRRVGASCRNDGKCARICETGAIGTDYARYDPGECIQCTACAAACHFDEVDFPVGLPWGGATGDAPPPRQPSFDTTRRQLAGWLGAGGVGAAFLTLDPKRILLGDAALRPPGALPEDDFLATCVRCGQCAKACPTHCLQPSTFETGAAGFMSPIARMRLGPCDQNCNACGQVCPTDAIRTLHFEEKKFAKIGNAVIEPSRCVVWEQGRPCLVCDEHCTYGAIYWQEIADGSRRPFINENRCNGCGQCEHACPVDGVAAIRIFPAGQLRLASGSYRAEAVGRGLSLDVKNRIY